MEKIKVSEVKDLTTARFGAVDGSSVKTKRNFGLLRDTPTGNLQASLQSTYKAANSAIDRRSSAPSLRIENYVRDGFKEIKPIASGFEYSQNKDADDNGMQVKHIVCGRLKKSKSLNAGDGTLGDKSCSKWDWPLSKKPKVTITDELFKVKFDVWPYTTGDIWTRVVGSEFILHLRYDEDETDNINNAKPVMKSRPFPGKELRPLFRTYQLPLNVDTKSVEFSFLNDHVFILSVSRIPGLQLAVACYLSDLPNPSPGNGESTVDVKNDSLLLHAGRGMTAEFQGEFDGELNAKFHEEMKETNN